MTEFIKIPQDRVGVLVGTEGKTKAMLEDKCGVKLDITHDGGVTITSPDEDGLKGWKALDVVRAVGRGFNPKYAIILLKEDNVLSVVNLHDALKKDTEVARVKARIIGEKGKAWQTMELLTNTRLSVYGRTVAIIGQADDVDLAERGIQMFVNGSMHANVFRFLENESKKRRSGL